MSRLFAATLSVSALALGACTNDPTEVQADAIEDAGENRADAIEADAKPRAQALIRQAETIEAEAAQATGFARKQLQVRSEALRKEAALINEQGNAQGDAIETRAEADAKDLRSQ